MRTPRRPQSALRAPLNEMLGTEANVRLLRVLVQGDGPITAGELARRADLNRTSVYPALNVLEAAGAIVFIGTGAQRLVQFRTAHPLGAQLAALFQAEAQRVDDLVSSLRSIAAELRPAPTSVWIEGPLLIGSDRPGDAIACYVLADPAALSELMDHFVERVDALERRFDVSIDVRGTTRSELAARADSEAALMQDAILLAGVPPQALRPDTSRARASGLRSHEDHDVRARRLAVAIATKLKVDPGLIRLARQHVAERAKIASAGERRELQEWTRILAMPASRLQKFLVEPGERATRLRQTLPSLDLLTPAERDAVLSSTTDAEARAAVSKRRRRTTSA